MSHHQTLPSIALLEIKLTQMFQLMGVALKSRLESLKNFHLNSLSSWEKFAFLSSFDGYFQSEDLSLIGFVSSGELLNHYLQRKDEKKKRDREEN